VTVAKDTLKDRLARYREINISVVGRKSGKTISNPVWFVAEGDTLYLLPVHGSETQWYKNVLKNPSIRIDARGAEAEIGDREVPRKVRGEGREEILFEIRRGGRHGIGLTTTLSASSRCRKSRLSERLGRARSPCP
jgi:deazaflavin-dependent oxidoreductase (nitroreductase family)